MDSCSTFSKACISICNIISLHLISSGVYSIFSGSMSWWMVNESVSKFFRVVAMEPESLTSEQLRRFCVLVTGRSIGTVYMHIMLERIENMNYSNHFISIAFIEGHNLR